MINVSRLKKIEKQDGLTILELMISLVIGLIALTAILKVFYNGKVIYNFQSNFSKMQEDIRFLNENFPKVIRLAGHRAAPQTGAFVTHGSTFLTTPYIAGENAQNNASDSVTVAYQGSSDSAGIADGKIKDCLNQNVKATSMVTNKFYAADGKLRCEVNNPDVSPSIKDEILIGGVENMQVIYGEDLDGDGVPNRYLSANSPDLQMSRVVSVKVNILLKSSEPSNLFLDNKQYTLFDLVNYQPGGSAGDRYLRIPVSFTILLRNLIPR